MYKSLVPDAKQTTANSTLFLVKFYPHEAKKRDESWSWFQIQRHCSRETFFQFTQEEGVLLRSWMSLPSYTLTSANFYRLAYNQVESRGSDSVFQRFFFTQFLG